MIKERGSMKKNEKWMITYQSEKMENIMEFGYHSSIHISKFYSITTNIYKNKKKHLFLDTYVLCKFFSNSEFISWSQHIWCVKKQKPVA